MELKPVIVIIIEGEVSPIVIVCKKEINNNLMLSLFDSLILGWFSESKYTIKVKCSYCQTGVEKCEPICDSKVHFCQWKFGHATITLKDSVSIFWLMS